MDFANMFKRKTILNDLKITEKELTEIVNQNPSLKGMLVGYAAEHHFKQYLDKLFILSTKDDDHDRKSKGDRRFYYKGIEYKVEVKNVQSNSVKKLDDVVKGKVQVDASDSREIELPNGTKIKTTCLLRDEFDILAVNLYNLTGRWEFAFIKNKDIPKNNYKKYNEYQKEQLLPTSVNIEWPLKEPFKERIQDVIG